MYGAIFDPIVKPEMRDSWNINMKKWFVLSDSVHDQLYPGKLKCELNVKFFSPEFFLDEFTTRKGEFIALSPKCYFVYDQEFDQTKLGSKGVPHSHRLEYKQFYEKLYNSKELNVEMQTLRLKKQKMSRVSCIKKALNSTFYKFYLHDDKISLSPLKLNGKYL